MLSDRHFLSLSSRAGTFHWVQIQNSNGALFILFDKDDEPLTLLDKMCSLAILDKMGFSSSAYCLSVMSYRQGKLFQSKTSQTPRSIEHTHPHLQLFTLSRRMSRSLLRSRTIRPCSTAFSSLHNTQFLLLPPIHHCSSPNPIDGLPSC